MNLFLQPATVSMTIITDLITGIDDAVSDMIVKKKKVPSSLIGGC